jgi:hypothetical protein
MRLGETRSQISTVDPFTGWQALATRFDIASVVSIAFRTYIRLTGKRIGPGNLDIALSAARTADEPTCRVDDSA